MFAIISILAGRTEHFVDCIMKWLVANQASKGNKKSVFLFHKQNVFCVLWVVKETHARIQKVLSVRGGGGGEESTLTTFFIFFIYFLVGDKVREDQNTTKSRPSSAHQRNFIEMAFS